MEVFICWSGRASHMLAEGLREWLPLVIQAVRPFLSSEDIGKGSRWGVDLQARLAKARFGVLCMTPENLNEPWIHFESGALSKSLETGRTSALLLEIKFSDLTAPLQQFQHTLATKKDIFKLIRDINAAMPENPLEPKVLESSFEAHWSNFEMVIERARKELVVKSVTAPAVREPSEMFDEILSVVRDVQREIRPLAPALQFLTMRGLPIYDAPRPAGGTLSYLNMDRNVSLLDLPPYNPASAIYPGDGTQPNPTARVQPATGVPPDKANPEPKDPK